MDRSCIYAKSRLPVVIWVLVVSLMGVGFRCGSASSPSPRTDLQRSTVVPNASSVLPNVTFAPAGDEYTFATFEEIEKAVGYRVLRADGTFRREFFNRLLSRSGSQWNYSEAYSTTFGSDQTTVMSVLQRPVHDGAAPDGWDKRRWSGFDVSLKRGVREVEAGFLTGATDASGVPIQAIVTGANESSVEDLITSLNFDYETP